MPHNNALAKGLSFLLRIRYCLGITDCFKWHSRVGVAAVEAGNLPIYTCYSNHKPCPSRNLLFWFALGLLNLMLISPGSTSL